MQLSIELTKRSPLGEKIEVTDAEIDALRSLRAAGFEVKINGQNLEAYTSINGAMPEAIGAFGNEMLGMVNTILTTRGLIDQKYP